MVYGAYIKEQEIGAKNVLWGPERGYGSRGIRSRVFEGIWSGDFGGIRSRVFEGNPVGELRGDPVGGATMRPLGGHQGATREPPGGPPGDHPEAPRRLDDQEGVAVGAEAVSFIKGGLVSLHHV